MHKVVVTVLVLTLAIAIVAFVDYRTKEVARGAHERKVELLIPPHAQVLETNHYRIHYTGTTQQAEQVGSSVEKLYAAYTSVFPQSGTSTAGKLMLVLYKDRREFKRNNRSSRWAEAYYLEPACYAYLGDDSNPYHWMTHEATHQLAREVSGLPRNRWIDEGLASYFSTSILSSTELRLGVIDATAYPIWWLGRYHLSGDPARDAARATFIPLEVLLTGQGGPDVDLTFNLYYTGAWSLTHFLFHYENGKYAPAYKQFLAKGATPADFASLIGPLEQIEKEWYRYLQELVPAVGTGALFEVR